MTFGRMVLLVVPTLAAITAAGQQSSNMTITSPAFANGGNIPSKYTCDGADVNPPLQFHGVPATAKGLVLIVDDPDAPGRTFTHWFVWNIDPKQTSIAEGARFPNQGVNDFGRTGYGGPCPPPSGSHRYFFRLYALDRQIELPSGSKRSRLETEMKGHIVAQAELMGGYERKK
jgi:Raf kinase inhibitor-like YbhB/YbcL family protein